MFTLVFKEKKISRNSWRFYGQNVTFHLILMVPNQSQFI